MVEEILTIPPQFPSAVFISEDSQSVRAQFELLNIVERPVRECWLLLPFSMRSCPR
jgi:hypothetical protein